MRQIASIFFPALTVAAALAAALAPRGAAIDQWPLLRYLVPLAPAAIMLYWLQRRPHAMPFPLIFATGLLVDTITRGPLGLWPFAYLIGAGAVRLLASHHPATRTGRFLTFSAGVVCIGAVAWLVASGYYLRIAEVQPILAAVAAVILVYPVAALVLGFAQPGTRRLPNASLDRGR